MRKIMLEATSPVVDGNTVVVAPGTLFDPAGPVPEGVTVREVIADVPDAPAPEPEPAPAKAPAKAAASK